MTLGNAHLEHIQQFRETPPGLAGWQAFIIQHLRLLVDHYELKCQLIEQKTGMTYAEYERSVYGKPVHDWASEQQFLEWDEYDTLRELYTDEWKHWKK